jgi:hypothetical protein
MKKIFAILLIAIISQCTFGREFHVSKNGNDTNDGSNDKPFLTISAAAQAAFPGDRITVHEGTYRERITPPRGGESDDKRIVYQAAKGEEVIIKGSEIVKKWQKHTGTVWKVTIPNTFFGDYNPYKDLIDGDWFTDKGRPHHTGDVYINGKSLFEIHELDQVINPKPYEDARDKDASVWKWYCESDDNNTTIYANFHGLDPNQELVEINVRRSCFYPDKPGRNFITIRGFRLCQAATQWAAPTAEQIGLIGTHWSKGWIIEDNIISDSRCSGITLGKDRETGHNVWSNDKLKDGATHYNEVIFRCLKAGWSKDNIGSHIIRYNTIFNCQQTGICGSMGGAFSRIENNHIFDIWTKRQFTGAEMGGIKIHASIDMTIKNNRIHNTGRGLWMDWMAQGTHITQNILYDNTTDDLFVEVNHGPFLVDNNLFMSELNLRDWSEGGAYTHNLFMGNIEARTVLNRWTPYQAEHSTDVIGVTLTNGGDNRFYNNIFVGNNKQPKTIPSGKEKDSDTYTGRGLWVYNTRKFPIQTGGNVFLRGAQPYFEEKENLLLKNYDPKIELIEDANNVSITINVNDKLQSFSVSPVTTELLGKTIIAKLGYENSDGSPLVVDNDFFGAKREMPNLKVGPLPLPATGDISLKIWWPEKLIPKD